MSYTVKRQGEIKSFQFLLEGSCADFVTYVTLTLTLTLSFITHLRLLAE